MYNVHIVYYTDSINKNNNLHHRQNYIGFIYLLHAYFSYNLTIF